MKAVINFFVCVFVLVSASFGATSVNFSEYQFNAKINVECDEYIGTVSFDAPTDYDLLENPKVYFDGGNVNVLYKKNVEVFNSKNNWYSSKIEGFDSIEIEKLTDNNYNTYLLADSMNSLEIVFNNPEVQKIDKVQIKVKDSIISSAKVFVDGKEVSFNFEKNLFTYSLIFNQPVYANEIKVLVSFNDLLKVEEIDFFEKEVVVQGSKMYFELNNECSKTFNLFYGEFGRDFSNRIFSEKFISKPFNVNVVNSLNSLYVDDFDGDGVLNLNDNCVAVANPLQKDINYNNIGDDCEDFDNDGIMNSNDNCVEKYNRDQLDDDGDGLGNVCDDGDGRFFESNKIIVYVGVILVCMLFIVLSISLFKKK